MHIPRLMIAAAGSGSGKTTVTCALLQMLSGMGKKTAAFKCGPDYIDPMFHQTVLGVPSKNLDLFFTEEKVTRDLFFQDAAGKEISILEGVMGLYDGLGGIRQEASSYHLAETLETPIILTVDARGMGRSLLPLLAGFLSYDTKALIKGVILNRIGKGFYEKIKPEIEKTLPVRVLGYIPVLPELAIESRHLGLRLPGEMQTLKENIRRAADILQNTLELPVILQMAEEAQEWYQPVEKATFYQEGISDGSKIPVGIAADEAFCFYYRDNLKLLEAMGAELVPFSPLHDTALPKGIRAMILGGGYPELYAGELSENRAMRQQIAKAVSGNLPSIAECGGFLYLHETISTGEQTGVPLAGACREHCYNTGKSVRFGYVELRERKALFLKQGAAIRGHEFHYFDSTNSGHDCIAAKPVSGIQYPCVHAGRNNWWGFPHLYYPSNPQYVQTFMERAAGYEE